MSVSGPTSGAEITVDDVSASYAGDESDSQTGSLVLSNVSFRVRPGESVVIVGPSGCGKTTLLKVVAGLLDASSGAVKLDAAGQAAPRLGFVFQADALLPWRTAVENVELAVRLAGESSSVARSRARHLMDELGLEDSCDKFPAQLSGGMRKRVSLARALAYQPAALLMDEPFAALDAHTRNHVGNFFLRIVERFGQTVLFVTHDIDEAVALGDRILVLSKRPARIIGSFDVQIPRPRDYYASRLNTEFNDVRKQVWELLG